MIRFYFDSRRSQNHPAQEPLGPLNALHLSAPTILQLKDLKSAHPFGEKLGPLSLPQIPLNNEGTPLLLEQGDICLPLSEASQICGFNL